MWAPSLVMDYSQINKNGTQAAKPDNQGKKANNS